MKRIVFLMAFVSSIGSAQGVQSVSMELQGAGSGKDSAVGSRAAVSYDFSNVPLGDALNELSRKSGVVITYSPEIVPVGRRVSYKAVNVPLMAALNDILKGTGVKPKVAQSGNVSLVKAEAGKVFGNKVQGIVSGRVMDAKTGQGISGASISLDGDSRGAVTGEDGAYRITGVGARAHVVNARMVGYAKQSRSVTVGEGATVTVDFKLEPSASVLDQVVVTGTVVATELKAVPSAITVVTAKQIEERGITRIDQLFRGDIPGLFSVNSGEESPLDSVSMFSRGGTRLVNTNFMPSTPIKVYLDGVELASPAYMSQIDPRSIERIEILTGPQASTIYGSGAINGVMQIFTKRGMTARPQVTLNMINGLIQSNFSPATTPVHSYDGRVSGTEGRLSYNAGGSWDYMGPWTPVTQTQRVGGYGAGRMQWGQKLTTDVSFRSGFTRALWRGTSGQGSVARVISGEWAPFGGIGRIAPTTNTLVGQTKSMTVGFTPLSWRLQLRRAV